MGSAANDAINHSSLRKALVFVPEHNTRNRSGKLLRDATGAFHPEAKRFLNTIGYEDCSRTVQIDNNRNMTMRRRAVVDELEAVATSVEAELDSGIDCVAFFCHGWKSGIQLGFRTPQTKELAKLIWRASDKDKRVVVALYCCSTGGGKDSRASSPGTGDNSFADKLRDELCALGAVQCRVVAHTSVAHTTKNPDVIFMDGMGTPHGGVGGYFPVARKTDLRGRWVRALKKGTLRFRFPFMTVADIHTEVA